MARKDIIELRIQEEDGKRRVSLTLVLPKRVRPGDNLQRVIIVTLAVAILGLVILLVFQIAPALGARLLQLLAVAH